MQPMYYSRGREQTYMSGLRFPPSTIYDKEKRIAARETQQQVN